MAVLKNSEKSSHHGKVFAHFSDTTLANLLLIPLGRRKDKKFYPDIQCDLLFPQNSFVKINLFLNPYKQPDSKLLKIASMTKFDMN